MSERPLLERMGSMVRSLGRVGQMNAAVLMLDAAGEITRLREELRQKDAAAPDLLAKLREVLDFYDALPSEHAPGEVELLDSITAILKATGGGT